MSSKKKHHPAKNPVSMRWEFDPDIPTHDFFDGRNLDELWDLQEAVDNFVSMMNDGTFLTWEAVACEEQGIPLTSRQKKALGGLLNFNSARMQGHSCFLRPHAGFGPHEGGSAGKGQANLPQADARKAGPGVRPGADRRPPVDGKEQ